MPRVYYGGFENVAVTAAQDLMSFLPATQKPVRVHAVYLSQSTDYGDAQEEGLRIRLTRGHTTVGSGGSTMTPARMDKADTAAGATFRINDTTIASAGSVVYIHNEVWNIRTPFVWMPAPEDRPFVINADYFTVRLEAAPADSVTMSGTLVFEEV